MKNILKSVKKKVSQSWDTSDDGNDFGHIANRELARTRMSRQVNRKVLNNALPPLRDVEQSLRSKLLLKKLHVCSFVFNFVEGHPDTPQEAQDKELKRTTLLELVNYMTVFKPSFVEREIEEIFEMLQINLFRALSPNTLETAGMYNPEEDEPQSEPTWPHLQVVYEFLLRLATSSETDPKLLQKYFSRTFVLRLLELFDSEDSRERDYLKTILHRIYGNYMSLRPFIRRSIHNVFYKFIYETSRHNGIAELLEILGSIINGFALPIKEQHKQFLSRVLLPLHKVRFLSVFHPQLSYCVTQFLEKDASLAPAVVFGVLKYWSHTDSKKELMFLNELEEILDRIQSSDLGEAQHPLFRQLARSISSPHFQVSERAIYVLNTDVILRFVTPNRDKLVPVLALALHSNTFAKRVEVQSAKEQKAAREEEHLMHWQDRGHWNPTIVELTSDILKLFHEMDATLMKNAEENHRKLCVDRLKSQGERNEVWSTLEDSNTAL